MRVLLKLNIRYPLRYMVSVGQNKKIKIGKVLMYSMLFILCIKKLKILHDLSFILLYNKESVCYDDIAKYFITNGFVKIKLLLYFRRVREEMKYENY